METQLFKYLSFSEDAEHYLNKSIMNKRAVVSGDPGTVRQMERNQKTRDMFG